jgi:hypothetical protein
LEAFLDELAAENGMAGNMNNYTTQWSHQSLQTPPPNPEKLT